MAYPLIIEPEAELDLLHAFTSYEDASAGLGRRFLRHVDAALDRIANNPEIHALIYRTVRRTLVRTFPYVVCYTFDDEQVSVLAVYHGHRDPDNWKSRLENR
jgi:toxin ParE1/3/4